MRPIMANKKAQVKWVTLLNQEMSLRDFTAKTKKTYLYALKRFVTHTNLDPCSAKLKDILDYQQHIIEEGVVSYSTYRINCCALRFFYDVAYPQNWSVEKIPYPKKRMSLPTVLSQLEVADIIKNCHQFQFRAIIQIMYGTGMRVNEVLNLKVSQVDGSRMRLRIVNGKGRVDRELPLSKTIRACLLEVYKNRRCETSLYFFPSRHKNQHLDDSNFHKALKATLAKTNIQKRVTAHTFRHSFATHHLENGINIRQLQKRLCPDLPTN
jgi:site-specific recombinase XerD